MSIQVSVEDAQLDVSSNRSATAANRDEYLSGLLSRVSRNRTVVSQSELLHVLCDRAEALVKEQAFPSKQDEDWRFTNLTPMLAVDFEVDDHRPPAISQAALGDVLLSETADYRLVFVNGIFSPSLSTIDDLDPDALEFWVGNLAEVQATDQWSRIEPYLAQQQGGNEVFTALNTAGFQDAAILWIPRNKVIETPIQLIFISVSGESPTLSLPRCLVVAEANSSVTLVEDYVGVGEGQHFTNAVTELWLGDNALVNHSRIQQEGQDTFHIGKTVVSQAQNSGYTCNAVALGAQLSRHNLEMTQAGPQTDTRLNGLSVIGTTQVADTHSKIAYTHPHGTADQLHKCIIDDRAHAIFNGKVLVPHEAQLTNASQLNRNLLLSTKARVDTKPQLEIVADNVKCAHGATVSQLEDDEVFYLQSRGIDKVSSQRLLISAFALDILNRIPVASLRDRLIKTVTEKAIRS